MSYSNQVMEELRVPVEALGVRRMMEFLVKTEGDYEELNAAIIEHNHLFSALANMRKNRLGKLSLDQFVELFDTDKKNALEQLFQEQIREKDITLLAKNNITSVQIYNKHKEMPTVTFIQIVYKEL